MIEVSKFALSILNEQIIEDLESEIQDAERDAENAFDEIDQLNDQIEILKAHNNALNEALRDWIGLPKN